MLSVSIDHCERIQNLEGLANERKTSFIKKMLDWMKKMKNITIDDHFITHSREEMYRRHYPDMGRMF